MSVSNQRSVQWYVVHMQTGKERKTCRLIETACNRFNDLAKHSSEQLRIDECFTPQFRSQKKWHGEWRDVERPLMPGYVVAVVDDPAKLVEALRIIPDFCQVVKSGEAYTPLTGYERSWIESYTQKGNRVVPMSFGYREGDNLTVMEGPLKGYEGQIVKIDRANSLAQLEFHAGQVTIKTVVGLGIVPKKTQQPV